MSGGSAASLLEVPYGNNRHRRSLSPMDSNSQYDGSRQRRSVSPMSNSSVDSRRSSRSTSPYDGGFDTRHCQGLSGKVALFNKQVNQHMETQAFNPFSGSFNTNMARPKFDKNDVNYGKPIAGSKTDLRGQKARSHVSKEILELCEVVAENGESLADGPEDNDCRVVISFGALFHLYTYISDKVVGILLRARKQKLIDFEGETLFQKRDDHIAIVLLKPIKEIRQHFKELAEKDRVLRKQQEHQLYLQQHPELELLLENSEMSEQKEEEQEELKALNQKSSQGQNDEQQDHKEENSGKTNGKHDESKKDLATIQVSVNIQNDEQKEEQQNEMNLDQDQSQVQKGQQNHKEERSDKTNKQYNESKKDLDIIQVSIDFQTTHIKEQNQEHESNELNNTQLEGQENNNILNNHQLGKQQSEEQTNINNEVSSEDKKEQNEEHPQVES